MTEKPQNAQTKRYQLFMLNHEEVAYRRAWLLPIDYRPQDDMYQLIGIVEVSNPVHIRSIESELRHRTSYPLAPEN